MDGSEELNIRLPDLFSDVMAGEYARNPSYEKVKPMAERWIEQYVGQIWHKISTVSLTSSITV